MSERHTPLLHIAMQSGPYLQLIAHPVVRRVVSEDSNPTRLASWSFLLIVRTPRIVTAWSYPDEYLEIHGYSSK